MKQLQSLSHTVWECKYHIVWIPKYRKKVLYGKIREELVGVFHELANRRGCKILEGHLCVDHVHMLQMCIRDRGRPAYHGDHHRRQDIYFP